MPAVPRLLALAVLLAPAAARADAAPPEDYVDPCASMKFEDSCRRCSAPEFKARDCHEGARAAGLVERCRGWNYAMYCKDGASTSPAEPSKVPEPPPVVRSPPPPTEPSEAPEPAAPGPAPVQQPAPPPAPPPAVATGGGCTIGGGRDAGLALVLLVAAGLRRRRAGSVR